MTRLPTPPASTDDAGHADRIERAGHELRAEFRAEIVVRVTEAGECQVLGPGKDVPLVIKPGERFTITPSMRVSAETIMPWQSGGAS